MEPARNGTKEEPSPDEESNGTSNGTIKKKREDMDDAEKSIYDEAVVACSIEVNICSLGSKC